MKTPDKQIIRRTLDNMATKEEARQVIRWFTTPEGTRYLSTLIDQEAKQLESASNVEQYAEHPIPTEEMYQTIQRQIRTQQRRRWLFRAAAILVPFILFLGELLYIDKHIGLFADSDYEEICVPRGERMQLIFQDGSRVNLNAETRIRYPKRFGFSERRVELEGEAYFEVTPNADRPFVVDMKDIHVKVLGTTFNVKAYTTDPDILVTLETGKILLASEARTLADMNPGDKAVYNRETGLCQLSRLEHVERLSAWKDNQLVFDDVPLAEVLEQLARWYDIEFVISDSAVLQYSYTLTATGQEISSVLRDMEKITPLRFIQKEKRITVEQKK